MFQTITPEAAGISSRKIEKLLRYYERRGNTLHSLLIMKGDDIFCESYWAPFHKEYCHRMYSQTKSYVGIAIGLLEEEGKLSLDDKIVDYFPDKIDTELSPYLLKLTVRQMLTMTTCGICERWFTHEDRDRVRVFFNHNRTSRPAGTLWVYDSNGSQVLGTLVERLSGMPLLEYLRAKLFGEMGTFKSATMLKVPTGESWADSALLCTTRDMASFGRLLLNGGTWEGKRLMNEQYVRTATSKLVDNDEDGRGCTAYGYGYQIWRFEQDSFGFTGMGNQMTVCVPHKDLVFTCTSDDQGAPIMREILIDGFFDQIVNEISDEPLDEDPEAYASLVEYQKSLKLRSFMGDATSPFVSEINGVEYACKPNQTGITKFSLHFDGEERGEFRYTNAQGDKVIRFGINHNEFGKFPQGGYSQDVGGERGPLDMYYDCAASAAWREEKKLYLRVQIIDRYFGNMTAVFAFSGDEVVVSMTKHAEDFMNEYTGMFRGKRQ